MSDDARRRILARRAAFVAAALAGVACHKDPAAQPGPTPSATPQTPESLSSTAPTATVPPVVLPDPDPTAPPTAPTVATPPADAGAHPRVTPPPPRPCLKVAPQPCLKVAPPK